MFTKLPTGTASVTGCVALLLTAAAPYAEAGPTAPPARAVAMEDTYTCAGAKVPLEVLREGRRATTLPVNAQKALQSERIAGIKNLRAWRVLEHTRKDIVVVRILTKQQQHRLRAHGTGRPTVGYVAIASEYTGGDGVHGWWYVYQTACELRRQLGRLGDADVRLNPAFPRPTPSDRAIHLLVEEQACASGRPPGSRVRLYEITRTKHRLGLAIGVRRPRGAQTCPGAPPQPVVVKLSQPLGDRKVVDTSVYPARRIPMAIPER